MQLTRQVFLIGILMISTVGIGKEPPTCNRVLESCAKTVEDQKKAIEKTKKVVSDQDEKIELLESRTKELQDDVDLHKKTSIGSTILTILLLIL